MRELLTEEFGEDLPVVSARYFLHEADLNFIVGNYEACITAADKGI